MRSRGRALWRALEARCAPHRRTLRGALALLAGGLIAAHLAAAGGAFWSRFGGAEPPRLALPAPEPAAAPEPPSLSATARPAPPPAAAFDWQSPARLRRAASVLLAQEGLINDDYAAAVELLRRGALEDPAREGCDAVCLRRAREALPALLAAERDALRAAWEALGSGARERLAPPGVERGAPNAAGLAAFLARGRSPGLLEVRDALPDALLGPFLGNLHVALLRAGASERCASIVLEAGFPEESLALRAFRARPPRERVSYAGR